MLVSTIMARHLDPNKGEEIWTREDLKKIMRNLSLLSEHGVREFYERAYRECRIISSHTFPPARAVQELVQAWKQLRKWRRPEHNSMPSCRWICSRGTPFVSGTIVLTHSS